MRIKQASLDLRGLPVSPAQARTLAERALARATLGHADGAGERISHLAVEVRPVRTDMAGLAEAIGQAVSTAVSSRREGG
jgi:hypothetical protein